MAIETIAVRMVAETERFTSSIENATSVMGMLRGALGIIKETAFAMVELGASYELAGISFAVMTGSMEKGAKLLEEINQLAIRSPFTSDQLIKSANMLLGFGTAYENIMPVMERLSDIASGNELRLRRLTLAFGQVMAAGRLYGTELRQFTEAGIGVADFARTAEMSTVRFRAAMENGRIGPEIMVRTIERLDAAGGRFANMNERVTATVSGSWNALKESVELFLAKSGVEVFKKLDIAGALAMGSAAFNREIKPMMSDFIGWIERAKPPAERLGIIFLDIGVSIAKLVVYMKQFVPTLEQAEGVLIRIERLLPTIAVGFQGVTVAINSMASDLTAALTVLMKYFFVIDTMIAEQSRQGNLGSLGKIYSVTRYQTGWDQMQLEAISGLMQFQETLAKTSYDLKHSNWGIEMLRSQDAVRRWTAQLQDSLEVLRVRTKPISEGAGALLGAGILAGVGINPKEPINIPLKLQSDVETFGLKVGKMLEEAGSPMEKFVEDNERLNKLMFGPGGLPGAGIGGIAAGIAGGGGQVTPEELDSTMVTLFHGLEKAIEKGKDTELPKAMLRGSSAAAEVIAKAQTGAQSTAERVADLLERANELSREKKENDADILAELKKFNQKGLGLRKGGIK